MGVEPRWEFASVPVLKPRLTGFKVSVDRASKRGEGRVSRGKVSGRSIDLGLNLTGGLKRDSPLDGTMPEFRSTRLRPTLGLIFELAEGRAPLGEAVGRSDAGVGRTGGLLGLTG